MAIEINQLDLHALFADPAGLYERVASKQGYARKTVTDFDGELIAPEWISMECILMILMVHHEKRAYLVMLPSDDLTCLREVLASQQVALNAAALSNAGRTAFGIRLPAK